MIIDYTEMNSYAVMPTKGSKEAAGNDLYALEDALIKPGEVHIFDTGIAVELPPGTFGAIFSRSGMSTKRGLTVSTGVSVIDSDYRNSIFVGIRNESNEDQQIYKGDRIAQLVLLPFIPIEFNKVPKLHDSKRGLGGLGSTGR